MRGYLLKCCRQVIHDNLEYLEDEDELDHIVPIGDDDPHGTYTAKSMAVPCTTTTRMTTILTKNLPYRLWMTI